MTKYALGIDIGSTTVKTVLTENGRNIYQNYQRHYAQPREKLLEMLGEIRSVIGCESFHVTLTGSAGMGLSTALGLPFVQEVFVVGELVRNTEPDTSAVIELGGEDAKIIFLKGGTDERMNGTCAGGTGAFIDQMAVLLGVTPEELDALSLRATRLYPIASRCGVFAKTDIQPLLNQGADKANVAASIYQAIVNQTVAGLAQGRKIEGKVLFLGGPLYYCKGLQKRFVETLKLGEGNTVFPEYAPYAVALGAAYHAIKAGVETNVDALSESIQKSFSKKLDVNTLPPLFETEEEYKKFCTRHGNFNVPTVAIETYAGKAYLGIDCGSTTTKLVLLSDEKEILYSYYASNNGNPVEAMRQQLGRIYELCGESIKIVGSAVTGYGEELIRNAFGVDLGIVETIAHYRAASSFCPKVDFILDIGGQDIKCFKIRNGAVDSIMLNEACSSGCGSFIETFARSMGYTAKEFAALGIRAKAPVNLGTRCTVFMNSSVKQAQKDGATVEDISAGLSVSVVKNALYKVIRASSPDELGENVVVQGGTFYNDAVLRAFELEMGREVVRPAIAGLMGAYGAALYSMKCESSSLISPAALSAFTHTSKPAVCNGCTNHCHLTINTFSDGKRFISGNRCEKAYGIKKETADDINLYEFKRQKLLSYGGGNGERGVIGIPMSLGIYELLPLWSGIFRSLGFKVLLSGLSTRRTYEKGQFSIPSDTACYPAKLMHGHIEELIEQKPDAIFYPCLSYNVDEKMSQNHYNCPVVAYYSELLAGNVDELKNTRFLYPYLNINNPRRLAKELSSFLTEKLCPVSYKEARRAVEKGFSEYNEYMSAIRSEGERAVRKARENGKRILILAGRPYHADPEINHGIDTLACSLGFVVVSEDSVCMLGDLPHVRVLNQWTYHARLYRAARFACRNPDVELVQLVSFGCGVDAITTDEVRRILEENNKLYTQIKIDEITNLGAVKIRFRSLLGALEMRKKHDEHK